MTLSELDTLLGYWRQVAEAALNNTMEVYENPSYKALCDGHFKGETATKLGEPGKINKLIEQASDLQSCVDRALEMRKGVTLLNRNERIAEIEALFTKDSIILGDEQTPLTSRTLTGYATVTRRCTPKELLDSLTSGFDVAKALVSEIDSIQTSILAKLDETARELDGLRAKHPSSSQVIATQHRLKPLESLVATDPIGLQKTFETEILPLLKAAREASEAEERQRVQLNADLAAAETLARNLLASHAEATARTAERKLKLTTKAPVPEALPEVEVQKTISWLSTLQKTALTTEWECVIVGLQKWMSKAKEQIDVENRAVSENQSLLEKRLELRGLLGALQAKVSNEGRAEDQEIFEIGRRAREFLYGRPTPMEEAEGLVRDYQKLS
jgi:hypothetical protein